MNITTQSVRFTTASHNTSIYLSRPIWSERTTVQFIRDGWFVNRRLKTFDSKEEALSFGLTVVKDTIREEVTSVNVEVSCEMLTGQEVMDVLVENGFKLMTVNFI
ncbi:hypothetical protein [Pseudomonas sichuanensis]|uniref:Uncharacterized protein n=1 Tax=Pseudomonas sichuanensis TaxID=2213015 RepID=A0ABV0DIS8_9PSED